MSQEVLNSHQPRITCLPNPGDYRLLNFIGKKELLCNVINNNNNNNNNNSNVNNNLWNLSFGTPLCKGYLHSGDKIWRSRKNVHIIFVFVTSIQGKGHFFWIPRPASFREHVTLFKGPLLSS